MKKTIFILLIASSLNAWAQPGQSDTLVISLEKALALAAENAADYQSQRLNAEITDKQLQQAFAKFYPQLSANYDLRYNIQRPTTILPGELASSPGESIAVQFGNDWNNTAGVELSQILFDAKLLDDLKIIQLNRRVDEVQAEALLENLQLATIRSYYQVLTQEAQLEQLRITAERLENTIGQTRAKVDAEQLNAIELERVNTAYQNALSDIAKAEQMVSLYRQLLNMALGMDPVQKIAFAEPLKSETEIKAEASQVLLQAASFEKKPAIRLQQLQADLIGQQINKQHRAIFPTASLYGYLGTNGLGNQFNWFDSNDIRWYGNSYVGLRLNWQLNTFFDNRFILPQLELQHQQIQLQRQANTDDISKEIMQAESNVRNAMEELDIQQRNISFGKKELDYLSIRFENDLISSSDLVDVEKNLRTYQAAYWYAYYNLVKATWELKKAKGLLTD